MKQVTALLIMLLAASVMVTACSKSNQTSTTTTAESAAPGAEASPPPASAMAASTSSLPIPLSKLPNATVAKGSVSAGAKVFSANCASCHGENGQNGSVGPTLAGAGLKAGQVAYMVQNPQAIDKSSGMPKLPLTKQQVADVAAYVASLK